MTTHNLPGQFYTGHIKRKEYGKVMQRRCVCFAIDGSGIVGASSDFNKSEAYANAQRAAAGLLPPLAKTPTTVTAMITAVLQMRGFPIRHINDGSLEVDDVTASHLAKEFAT